MIRVLTTNDIPSVLKLAEEVEPLFGPMIENDDFINALKNVIQANNAFGYDNTDHLLSGAIVIDRNENTIEWLAVASTAKQRGIGSLLLEKALKNLDPQRPVLVQTFSSTIKAGIPAKKLYSKYGFYDVQDAGKNPAGIDTVLMKRDAINLD